MKNLTQLLSQENYDASSLESIIIIIMEINGKDYIAIAIFVYMLNDAII